jgi:hypothetical protein
MPIEPTRIVVIDDGSVCLDAVRIAIPLAIIDAEVRDLLNRIPTSWLDEPAHEVSRPIMLSVLISDALDARTDGDDAAALRELDTILALVATWTANDKKAGRPA